MDFYEKCKGAIETFDILVIRVHDIYSNRILNVLMSMQDVCLQSLPGGNFLFLETISNGVKYRFYDFQMMKSGRLMNSLRKTKKHAGILDSKNEGD